MSKHTPGPWKVDKDGQLVVAENPYGEGLMMIAKVRGWGHLTGKGACAYLNREAYEIHNANMNLIAAAPELLEALKDVVAIAYDAMCLANRDGAEYDQDDWLREAREAIAKAEGKV